MRFSDLGLSPELLRVIEEAGYDEPTPVQAQAIPTVLSGRDILAIAQTGTGKTASFTFPMIDLLKAGRARARMPRSIILSPVRELATQTASYFESYGKHARLSKALIIGGVGLGGQEKELDRGVDVLIATPGRLIDQFERGNILLTGVEMLVIDEADRMLDMGFIPDVERIVSMIPPKRQTLLFSATMPKEIRHLADRFMKDPTEIIVSRPATTATNVDDRLVPVDAARKVKALRELIEREEIGKAIVFVNTRRGASTLKRQISRTGLNASDIHGNLDQSERDATLRAFKDDTVDFLVATDVAARGLDINDLPCVINFDVPTNPDDYVHRIGRTGRAGALGRAFTFITKDDDRYIQAINRHTGREIPTTALDGFEPGAPVPLRPSKARAGSNGGKLAEPDAPATSAKSTARKARPSGKANNRGGGNDEPVVGLGDHVPPFLLRPVKLRAASAKSDES